MIEMRHQSNSGTLSIDVCCLNLALMVHIKGGALAEMGNGLPGGIEVSCFLLVQGESVSLLVSWHTIIPPGLLVVASRLVVERIE